jgi:hypothetical protein
METDRLHSWDGPDEDNNDKEDGNDNDEDNNNDASNDNPSFKIIIQPSYIQRLLVIIVFIAESQLIFLQ